MQYKTFHIYCIAWNTNNAPDKWLCVRWLVGSKGIYQLKGKKSDDFLRCFFKDTLLRPRNRFNHNEGTALNLFFGGIKRRGNNHIAGWKSGLHGIRLQAVRRNHIGADKLIQDKKQKNNKSDPKNFKPFYAPFSIWRKFVPLKKHKKPIVPWFRLIWMNRPIR